MRNCYCCTAASQPALYSGGCKVTGCRTVPCFATPPLNLQLPDWTAPTNHRQEKVNTFSPIFSRRWQRSDWSEEGHDGNLNFYLI